MVNAVTAEDLAMQEARPSAALELTQSEKIPKLFYP